MNIFEKTQTQVPRKAKIAIPLFFIYCLLLLVTMIPLPSYILGVLVTFITFLVLFFIKYILDAEQKIIAEYDKKLNDFHELFVDMSTENAKLSGELEREFKDFDEYVISSKTDLFGRITYASKSFRRISGYSEKELLGEAHNIVRHPDMPKSAFENMWKILQDNHIWSGEVKNKKKSGGYYIVKAIVSPIYNNDGMKIGYNSIRQLLKEGD